MIRVIVSYPNQPGAKFDEKYYFEHHCPMVEKTLGPLGLAGFAVDRGLAGVAPGSPPNDLIQAHILFENMQAYQAAMGAAGAAIVADIPNFTDIRPVIQVNEIVFSTGVAKATSS
jgi:uncharacterized protein (TIGR02118 family)